MVKVMDTKLPWTGPSLNVKVALVRAEEEEADSVAEAREVWEVEEVSKVPEQENREQSLKTLPFPPFPLPLKERTLGYLLCLLLNDGSF